MDSWRSPAIGIRTRRLSFVPIITTTYISLCSCYCCSTFSSSPAKLLSSVCRLHSSPIYNKLSNSVAQKKVRRVPSLLQYSITYTYIPHPKTTSFCTPCPAPPLAVAAAASERGQNVVDIFFILRRTGDPFLREGSL